MVTRTISTKLAIEGESEYRASLSRINTEIKTLQSALKLTESQYQNNANSMAALTAKGESLTRLYEAQKSKVAELKSALENAKSAEQNYASQKAELTAKIEANNKALEALKSTSGDTTKEQAALNAENKQLTEELGKCEANLIAAEKGVNNWQTQLNNAEATLNDLDAEIQQNDKYLDEAKESADGCATSIDQYGNKTESATDATKDLNDALAAAGLIAALKKTADAIEACISAAADFEFSMSGVAAISGATAEEMEILNSKAKEIGATTMYTAQQAAESMQYMALAGWSAAEMIEGIDGVISLAAASGEDLSQVCDIVTDALTAFGLTASDTSRFVDVLASTAANSNTTVHLLGEAFKYAAPVAGALGYSVEDVAVAMGLMANNGIKGGMAGTALRNVFSALADEVKLTGAAFGEATIITTNADGSMKDLSRTIDDLRYYFGQMTQAEQVNNAQALAGQRAYAGLLAILNTTEDDFNTLTAAINESTGAAKQMQDIRMDNFTGQVTLLKSAWDAVKVSLGEQLLPALTSVAAAATDVLSWTADMIEKNQWLAPAITAVAIALGTLAAAVAAYVVVQKIATAAAAAFTAILQANPIFLAVTAIAALAAGVGVLALCLKKEAVPEVNSLNTAVDNMKSSFAEAAKECKSTETSVLGTANIASSYIDRLSELEKQTSMTAAEQDEYRTIVDKLRYLLPDVNIELNEQTGLLIGGAESIRRQVDAWKELAIQEALQKQFTAELEAYADAEAAAEIARVRLSSAEAEAVQLAEELKVVYAEYSAITRELSDLERDGTISRNEYKEASAALKEEQSSLQEQMATLYDEIKNNENAQKDLAGAIAESEAAIEEYKGPVEDARAAIDSYNEQLQRNTELQGENAAANSAAASEISDRIDRLAEAYKECYDAAYDSISGQIGLFDTFAASISEDTNTVEKMMQIWAEQTQNLAEYTENLRRAAEYGVDQGLVLSLSDGSTESAGYIATIVAKIEELGGTTEGMSTEAAAFVSEFNASFARTAEARESFADTVAKIETDFDNVISSLEQTAANVNFSGFTDAMNAAFSNVGVDFNTIGVDAGSGLASGISTTSSRVSTESKNMAQGAIDAAKSTLESHSDSRVMIGVGKDFVGGMITGVKSREPELKDLVRQAFEAIDTDVKRITTQTCKAAVDEFGKLPAAVRSKLQELKNTISRETSSMPSAMQNTGVQIVDGMIYGMNSRSSSLYSVVRSIVNNAIAAARAAAATASPSRKTTKIFEDVGEGMIVGLERKREKVAETARKVVDEALSLDISDKINRAIGKIDDTIPYLGQPDFKGGDVINNNINLEVHMDGVTVREKADIDEFTDALFDKVRREIRIRGNNALW